MFESQIQIQAIKDCLKDAAKHVRLLQETDDIESPGPDYCQRLATSIRQLLEQL